MNPSQTCALAEELSGLSRLVEAATALAKLTSAQHSQQSSTFEKSRSHLHQLGTESTLQSRSQDTGLKHNIGYDEGDSLKSNGPSNVLRSIPPTKETFPVKLMSILNESSLSDVITWLPHGRSFVVIRPDVFTENILRKYFSPVDSRSSFKYTSFTRKLNRWGFRQLTRGSDTGAFHHPLFRRDKPELCMEMICKKFRGRKSDLESNQAAVVSTNHQPKKRNSATLSRESLEIMELKGLIMLNTNLMAKAAPVTVSEDGCSQSIISSQHSPYNDAPVCSVVPSPLPKTITNDVELTLDALRKRNETERLRTAKAMLFESYCRAMRGE